MITIGRYDGYPYEITIQLEGYEGIKIEIEYADYILTESYEWLLLEYGVDNVATIEFDDPPPGWRRQPPPTKPDHLKIKLKSYIMKFTQRVTSKTPPLFNWLKGAAGTVSALFLTLSATVPADKCLFDIEFFNTGNMLVLGIIFGVMAGTYHMAKKDK